MAKEGTRLSARVPLAREAATVLSYVTGGGREREGREGGRDGWRNKALRFQSLNSFVLLYLKFGSEDNLPLRIHHQCQIVRRRASSIDHGEDQLK